MNAFEARLRSAGMSEVRSAAKNAWLLKLSEQLGDLRGGALQSYRAFFVPGRLEFLGKHTDYAGGRSLVSAVERGICMVAAPRTDAQVRIVDAGRQSEASFLLGERTELARTDWSKYAVTVARRIARDFPSARFGADIVFTSDLPRASGMSSSSALIVAVFLALAKANSLEESELYRQNIHSREDLAGYLAAVENGSDFAAFSSAEGVGTFGGSEDHVAILCSRAGFLRQYSYCPIRLEREIPIPRGHTFVIGASGVKADKTGNARESYNRISLAAKKILALWRGATGRKDVSLAAVLNATPNAAERLRKILRDSSDSDFPSQFLLNRLAQFSEESNELVPKASEALECGDLERLGTVVDRSEFLAETLLGNQTPETIELARSARALGAAAASAFGAGFGGSVWALVPLLRAEEFREAWAARYHQRAPERVAASEFLITSAGPGMIRF
jgi:galactokinase